MMITPSQVMAAQVLVKLKRCITVLIIHPLRCALLLVEMEFMNLHMERSAMIGTK